MRKTMVLALISLFPVASFAQQEIPSIVTIHEVAPALEEIFTEPFETLALITSDGKAITLTNQLANQVRGSIYDLEAILKSIDQDFNSVELIIHNHPTPSRWSFQDKRLYYRLRREGYTGEIGLYFPWSGSMKYLGDDEDERNDKKIDEIEWKPGRDLYSPLKKSK